MKAHDRIKSLLVVADKPLSGVEIGSICNVWAWRLYPMLFNLEQLGYVKSEFEELEAGSLFAAFGLPRRRLYWWRTKR